LEGLSGRQACAGGRAESGLIVFVGPSLGARPTAAHNIDFLPPARCGDITRVLGVRPTAIGLIDGVFETTPSVWHKEIIYALSLGVTIFGAASIGALRAVELAPFGMIGVGEVFRAYRDGEIEDDDEVAVLHGPAELGFPALTEAMVNVRATLGAANQANVLRAHDRMTLSRAAKSIFYKHRTWDAIANRAVLDGIPLATLEKFAKWRRANYVDVKRRDAELLIAALQDHASRRSDQDMALNLSRTTYWIAHEKCHAPRPRGRLRNQERNRRP
jgi:hypothetical protein